MLAKAKDFASKSPMPSGMHHELDKNVLPEYYLEPGDRILIEPVELDSMYQTIGDQVVLIDGSADLGRFGRIRVSGMTVESVENVVMDQIKAISGKRETINVQLLETNGSRVYVLGAVGSPGSYELRGRETVLDAILFAGGLTSKASPCDIILVRPTNPTDCRVVQKICFRQITQLGDVTTNYQLQPGDRIVVSERTLREELAFWRQTAECPCCDRSRCIQCDPTTENYRNRFVNWLGPFPLPALQLPAPQAGKEKSNDRYAEEEVPKLAPAAEPYPLGEDANRGDDSKFFLSPEPPLPQSLDDASLRNLAPTSENNSSRKFPAAR